MLNNLCKIFNMVPDSKIVGIIVENSVILTDIKYSVSK